MSPLQYLKQLRLQEARQLLLKQNIDAGSAAVLVGYESASTQPCRSSKASANIKSLSPTPLYPANHC
jgi:transcriptional regulator GlxA family with amidase domain